MVVPSSEKQIAFGIRTSLRMRVTRPSWSRRYSAPIGSPVPVFSIVPNQSLPLRSGLPSFILVRGSSASTAIKRSPNPGSHRMRRAILQPEHQPPRRRPTTRPGMRAGSMHLPAACGAKPQQPLALDIDPPQKVSSRGSQKGASPVTRWPGVPAGSLAGCEPGHLGFLFMFGAFRGNVPEGLCRVLPCRTAIIGPRRVLRRHPGRQPDLGRRYVKDREILAAEGAVGRHRDGQVISFDQLALGSKRQTRQPPTHVTQTWSSASTAMPLGWPGMSPPPRKPALAEDASLQLSMA